MKHFWLLWILLIQVLISKAQVESIAQLEANKHKPVCIAYSPDGRFMASGGFDEKIIIFNLKNGVKIKTLEGLRDFPVSLTYTPDGKHIISGGKDEKVTIWNVATQSKRQLKGHKKTIRDVAISPDGKIIASASDDENIILWEFQSGRVLHTIEAHKKGVNAVDFNPRGNRLVSGGIDQHIKIWDVKTGKKLMDIAAHEDRIRDARFSPDGTIIASAGDDKSVNFWSADNGELLNSIRVHKKWVQTIAFSPDGQYLVSGGHDNILIVTNIDKGNIVFKSPKQNNYVLSVAFHPTGENFASAFLYDKQITIWDADSLNIEAPRKIAAGTNQKEKPKPVKKPTIQWTSHTMNITVNNEVMQVNACINSMAPLRKASIWQNGKEIYTIDRKEIMTYTGDCTYALTKNIFLQKGENKIIIKARNAGGQAVSKPLILTFKEKVDIEFAWNEQDNTEVNSQLYNLRCCINAPGKISTVEIFNNDNLVANITSLVKQTKNCEQFVDYPIALKEGPNKLQVKVSAGNAVKKITKTIVYQKETIAGKQAKLLPDSPQVAEKTSNPTETMAPKTIKPDPYRFALIIGNEDYSSYQVGLESESNVDFARNDAKAFKRHAVKYLRIPEENIIMLLDARYIQMRRALKKMSGIIEMTDGKAEVFFYYAGHGFPHEKTKEPYFVPVDGSGTDLEFSAIKQKDVYNMLTKHPSKRVTVFIDACFSGGARNHGLVAARGVKIKPRTSKAKGKMVVFTASSKDQSSLPYKAKSHGMFTWYLLQKIEETNGKVNYQTLADYIKEQVGIKSYMINSKRQVPQINVSPSIAEEWKNWQLIK